MTLGRPRRFAREDLLRVAALRDRARPLNLTLEAFT